MELPLIAVLFLLTAGAVIVFALRSKARDRMDDSDAPKSTLAKDAPDH